MRRGCFPRFLFTLLILFGSWWAVNRAYQSGFALGYMTRSATIANDTAGAAQAAAMPAIPGYNPWMARPHGPGFPFGLFLFGFLAFMLISGMFRRRRWAGHWAAPGGHGEWSRGGRCGSWPDAGPRGQDPHRGGEPREKGPKPGAEWTGEGDMTGENYL